MIQNKQKIVSVSNFHESVLWNIYFPEMSLDLIYILTHPSQGEQCFYQDFASEILNFKNAAIQEFK